MRQALNDLADEGLVQVFKPSLGANWIVGVVGVLQLDVLKSRAKQDYRIDIEFEPINYSVARWLRSEDEAALNGFIEAQSMHIMSDRNEDPVFLANGAWELDYHVKKHEGIEFLKTKEIE